MREFLIMLSASAMLVIVDDERRRAFVAIFRRAIGKADLTELQHCQGVGINQGNFSASCAAQKAFDGEALIRTETETWRWFSLLYLLAYGLPREVRTAAPIVKRMARMDLDPPINERKAL